MERTRSILISIDTHHRRKPAPIMFDCALESKTQLRLMHFALEALNGELVWHFLIFSASSSQFLWKCPPFQKLTTGASVGPEKQQR